MIRPYPAYLLNGFVEDPVFNKLIPGSIDFARFIDQTLFEGERAFELLVWEYPYEVQLPQIADLDTVIDRIVEVSKFCHARFGKKNVICFPDSAIGQYKLCACNSVFFKRSSDAMICKMVFGTK